VKIAPPPSIPNLLFSPTDTKPPDTVLTSTNNNGHDRSFESSTNEQSKAPPPDADSDSENVGCVNSFQALLAKRAARKDKNWSSGGTYAPQQSESDMQWKKAAEKLSERPSTMIINDLDFSDFSNLDDDQDPLVMTRLAEVAVQRGYLSSSTNNGIVMNI
jgi:hypothetical protein